MSEETITGGTPDISSIPLAIKGKSIAIIIAFRDFRDEEYFVPKEILETAGAEITTASTQTGKAIGADGGEVEIAFLLKDLNVVDFDAIIFIGGPGTLKYLDNEESYQIAKKVISQGKLLAAICISPVILAKAGVLEGVRATVWSSPLDKTPVRILKDHGALYQAEPVVADGKIITGNGPSAAKEFGETIVLLLTG